MKNLIFLLILSIFVVSCATSEKCTTKTEKTCCKSKDEKTCHATEKKTEKSCCTKK